MNDLEKQLRLSKPEVPELGSDFSERVLLRIDELELSPAPAAYSWSKWAKAGVGMLLIIACLLIFNYLIFAIQMSGGLELLSFGSGYLIDTLNYVPLDLVGLTLILTAGAAWVIQNSKFIRVRFLKLAIGSYLVVGTGGMALAATGINEQIQFWAINKEAQKTFFSQVYLSRAKYVLKHDHFAMGQIVSKSDNQNIWIINPRGEKVKVTLPTDVQVKVGEYVKFSGNTTDSEFQAREYRHCGTGTVSRLFHHMKDHNHHKPGMMRRHRMMMGGQRHR